MMKKHGYFSNNRPTLGLLTSGGGDPVGHFVWSGVANITQQRDANLICFPGKPIGSPHGFESQANVLYDLIDTQIIDGLVIWLAGLTFHVDMDDVRSFCDRYRGLPIVTVGVHIDGIPCVAVDNYHGMRNVISHIVDVHGRTRIAFIRGPEHHQEAEERYHAYKDVLEENGIPVDPSLVAFGGFKESGGKAALDELIDGRHASFDALVAASDNMAIAAMKALQGRGVRVPEDVSVAGLNDELQGRVITPPLTTGPLHFYEQGAKAAEMVLDLLAGHTVPENVVLPTQLLVRQSCGCPDPLVIQAAVEPNPISDFDMVELPRNTILSAMLIPLELEPTRQNLIMAGQVYDTFIDDVRGRSRSFLPHFSDVLRKCTAANGATSKWHAAISVLRYHIINLIDAESLRSAENLFQQARVLIGETSQRVQALQRLQAEQQSQVLSDINQQLSATIDGRELLDMLEKALPLLNIARCYISLYNDPEVPIAWSRLVMAYDERGRIKLDASIESFPSRDLVPADILAEDHPYSFVVEPLYFRNDQLGFALLDADSDHEEIYEILRGQISGALKRTRLAEHNIELYTEAVQARRVAEDGMQLAEQANSLKSRFLATVSHELRTPLTLIVGMIEMMLAEDGQTLTALPESYHRDLKSIRTSAQHLARLISDVLDLASSQAGELHLNCEPLSLETIIQETMLLSEAIVREKGLTWKVDFAPNLPIVWADRTRLKQIILNLVSNASKFTHHGAVTLSVAVVDKEVTITVSDTGIGIPKNELDKIFDEFQQSERTTRRGYGGMGLGLAITRRLVELHGGRIAARSSGEDGGGSTFTFTLPVMAVHAEAGVKLEKRAQTVLVLSESQGDGLQLLEYLSKRGFEVDHLSIASHPDWFSQVALDPPGALVIDTQPEDDKGWELIKLLKQNPVTQDVPVVFYSLSDDKNRGAILELDYLTKPVKRSELVQALERQGVQQKDGASSKTIMIVDDDQHILNLHARIIESRLANCTVIKAHNGREALEMMQKETPDLVLLDLMMPEIDGFGVLEFMRASEHLRNIPVIILTAQMLTTADMSRLQRGVTAVLSKGLFSKDEVLAQVESTLSRSKHLGSETRRVIRQAMAYIHEHFAEQISREQLAQYIGLSERHLNRCFNEETGMPIMTYLNRYRVRQAKILLEKGTHSIAEVALASGFSRMNYFGRVFRQEVGVSPGAYLRGERSSNE